MVYLSSATAGSTIYHWFNTKHNTTQAPITFGGSASLTCYKQADATQDTSGITLAVDYDGVTGLHTIVIDTSADTAFYTAGSDFAIVVAAGTVNSVSTVGTVLAQFSLV